MNKFIFFLLFSIIGLSSSSQQVYENTRFNFSFSIPDGWNQMSKETVEFTNQQIGIPNDVEYDAGLYLNKGKNVFDFNDAYPYILIDFIPINIPLDEIDETIVKYFGSEDYEEYFGDLSDETKFYINKIGTPSTTYVEEKKMIVSFMVSDVKGIGKVFMISNYRFTENGVLGIYYYDSDEKLNKSVDNVFHTINESLKFE